MWRSRIGTFVQKYRVHKSGGPVNLCVSAVLFLIFVVSDAFWLYSICFIGYVLVF